MRGVLKRATAGITIRLGHAVQPASLEGRLPSAMRPWKVAQSLNWLGSWSDRYGRGYSKHAAFRTAMITTRRRSQRRLMAQRTTARLVDVIVRDL